MKIKRKILTAIILLFILIFALFIYLWYNQNVLEISNYYYKTEKINSSVKIAFISDMHNKTFGKNNSKLIDKIRDENVDYIVIGGDMLTQTDTNHSLIPPLLKQLNKIAPTFYALGNHELAYKNLEKLKTDIINTNATLLDNKMITLDINGENLTIGGLTNFPYYESDYPDFENDERYFLDSFLQQQKNNFSILLAHQPEWYMWDLKDKKIDLILSGHTHGGIIQLPIFGGLYAPTQKFFPEYDKGFFSENSSTMIITGGLGNNVIVPRINNQPEICIININ